MVWQVLSPCPPSTTTTPKTSICTSELSSPPSTVRRCLDLGSPAESQAPPPEGVGRLATMNSCSFGLQAEDSQVQERDEGHEDEGSPEVGVLG